MATIRSGASPIAPVVEVAAPPFVTTFPGSKVRAFRRYLMRGWSESDGEFKYWRGFVVDGSDYHGTGGPLTNVTIIEYL